MKQPDTIQPQTPSQFDPLIDTLEQRGEQPLLQIFLATQTEEWSYGRFGHQVRALARGLRQRVDPGEAVALLGPETPEWIIAALAVLRAGAVVMPLDLQLADDTLKHILQDSGAPLIFTTSRHQARARTAAPQAQLLLLDVAADDPDGWQNLLGNHTALPANHSDDTAALFYTSGTTGPPKGVPLSHGNLAFQLDTVAKAGIVRDGDRVLLPLPLHHVYPFVIGLLTPISLGLTLIIPYALTGPQLMRALHHGKVTVIIGVPRLYQAMFDGIINRTTRAGRLAALLFHALLRLSLISRRRLGRSPGKWLMFPLHHQVGRQLRILACGGAALDPDLAWNLEALGWQVAVGYGLTETAPLLTIDPPGQVRPGTVGKPVPGVELRIDRQAAPRKAGREEGEIQARGPNVFSGYRNQADQTRAAFSEDGWFRTGDLGWLDDDGHLHVSGRASTLIVTTGGENIQPDDLEARYAAHEAIKEVGILQHHGRLAALVVPTATSGDDVQQRIRAAIADVAARLPSYQRLDDFALTRKPLPRTRLGKIQRHTLEERYERARAGEGEAPQQAPLTPEEMSSEDRNLLEEPTVRSAWEWLARRYPKRGLTPDSHLQLELGVDSLEWLNLTMEIGRCSGVELDDEAIGRIKTVRDLLHELINAADRTGHIADPIENPEQALGDRHRRWLGPRNALVRGLATTLYGINRTLMHTLFRLQVQGRQQVPSEGVVVFACNHASYLDPFAVGAALPTARLHTLYWGGWTGVAFTNRLTLLGSRIVQIIPIDPEHGARSSLALAAAVLSRDRGLIWFPEGERSRSGELLPFRPGIGMLLQRFPVPVVPVFISGSHAALPPGRRIPHLGRISLRFGAALDPHELAKQGKGDDEAARIVDALHTHMYEQLERTKA